MEKNAINRFVEFIKRKPNRSRVNMLRASSNAFLRKPTDQFRSIYILRLGAEAFQLGLVNSMRARYRQCSDRSANWLAS